jgi:hypothetical protein
MGEVLFELEKYLIIAPLVHNCKASKILNWLYTIKYNNNNNI